jgi:dipeptidyl aminopeptidase/acylaminoacyl peptidase
MKNRNLITGVSIGFLAVLAGAFVQCQATGGSVRATSVPREPLDAGAPSPTSSDAAGPSVDAGPARPPLSATAWRPLEGPTMDQLLNLHRAHSPSLSPDGRTVLFLSDAPGVLQPFALTVGPEPVPEASWRRLATIDDRVHFIHFAPGGRAAIFGRDFGGDENVQLYRVDPARAEAAPSELTSDRRVKHMFGAFSESGREIAYASNERNGADFDIYVRPIDGGAARRLYDAQGHNEAQDFSRDGRQLLVTHERSNFDTDATLVEVATGRTVNLNPHTGDERAQSPRFTRDGRAVLLVSDRGREFMNLAIRPLPEGELTFVLDEAHDVEGFELSGDRRTAAIVYNMDGRSELRLYDVQNPRAPRELARPRLEAGWISHFAFAQDGRALGVSLSRGSLPDELYRVDARSGATTRVSASDRAGVDTSRLVDGTIERVRSFDGTEVPVIVYRPRGLAPGVRAPVIVNVHGGPEAQSALWFSPVMQFLVGHGYIVVEPNVRGSTGFGKRYSHMDDVGLREDSVRDLGEVNRWLRTLPDVDPDRIAVMGGSYGGYMTLAAITLQPELWAAACDIVGIANFRTFLQNTAAYRRALREAEYGSLARDGAILDRVSPIHRVDRITTPLMVIHGARDPRVPVGEAEQIVAALRARGRTVEYLRFENEGHGVSRRENRVRAYGELVRFFDDVMLGRRR